MYWNVLCIFIRYIHFIQLNKSGLKTNWPKELAEVFSHLGFGVKSWDLPLLEIAPSRGKKHISFYHRPFKLYFANRERMFEALKLQYSRIKI